MLEIFKTSTVQVPYYVRDAAVYFFCATLLYCVSIFVVLAASLRSINKAIFQSDTSMSASGNMQKSKRQPVKYSLLLKHMIIATFMLLSLSLFTFCLMQLTQDFEKCTNVCVSLIWLARSLSLFMIALFASQLSLYHMCYEQIKALRFCKQIIMLQHGGFNYEVENVLEKSGSSSHNNTSEMSRTRSQNRSQYSSNYVETEGVEEEDADRNATALLQAFDELYENPEEHEADLDEPNMSILVLNMFASEHTQKRVTLRLDRSQRF